MFFEDRKKAKRMKLKSFSFNQKKQHLMTKQINSIKLYKTIKMLNTLTKGVLF